jgi:NAD(P)-dependent dehydrogenase (short-subunit alcohol dehydrogenase family)
MDRVVCITGAAGGIGSATAKVFAQAGWYVTGVDREQPPDFSNAIKRFVSADLSDPVAVAKIFVEMTQREGRLDALINNAAIQVIQPLVKTEIEEWDAVMSVNVRAAYLGIKHAFPLLRRQGGSIVNVSSVHAVATSENIAAYAASKGALVALTRAAALELASDRIRVNAILPGAVDTEMLRAGLQRNHAGRGSIEQRVEALASKHVLGRLAKPEEIAKMILVLADHHQSAFMTGQTLVVDGGAVARLSTE